MSEADSGILIIVSGPSGVGKSTIVRELMRRCDLPLALSVSATTRAPRAGEVEGVDYHFLSRDEFARRRQEGAFLECCEVFGTGDWYGTPRNEVEGRLENGKMVILEIDVQGALYVMQQRHDVVSIFIQAASPEILADRLRGRGTEKDEVIQRRLERSQRELAAAHRYMYRVVNDDVHRAVQEICDILRTGRQPHHA